jgi:hypothetical protein
MQEEDTARRRGIGIWMMGLLLVGLVAGVAAPAKATLQQLNYTGTLSFQVTTDTEVSGIGAATSAAVTAGGHLSTLAIPGGFAPINTSLPVTSSGTIQSFRYTDLPRPRRSRSARQASSRSTWRLLKD